ncbi:type 4a pilus biogenesis protein PilO [Patescibacteria group bacterium]|nr:type 4a pilus biogenesis protein PilO [Patescibacteria group bacterium]
MKNNKKPLNIEMIITNRKQMLISVVLGVVSFGLVFLAIIPQFQEFWTLKSELDKEIPRLTKLKQKLVELENIQFTPEFAQSEIVNNALPSKKPLLELLSSLSSIAAESSVQIKDFDLNPGIIASDTAELQAYYAKKLSKDGIDTLDISMNAVGSFENIQVFLINLEKISPFTTINTLSLNSSVRGDDFNEQELNMLAKLTTKSHFFTQTVSAAIEAPLPILSFKEQNVLEELASFSSSDLPEQLEIKGGGLEDLFGVDPINFE